MPELKTKLLRLLLPLCATLVVLSPLWAPVSASIVQENWCRVGTSEFELYSYLPEQEAKDLAQTLLKFNQITADLLQQKKITGHNLRVVAFPTQSEFVSVFQEDAYIGFMQPSLRFHTLAFPLDSPGHGPLEIAFHEYTHFLTRSRIDTYVPLWYEEGFAQLMSTLVINRKSATLGAIPVRKLRRTFRRFRYSWPDVLSETPPYDWQHHKVTDSYRIAWAITHFLNLGTHPDGSPLADRIPKLLEELSKGRKADEVLFDVTSTGAKVFGNYLNSHLRDTASHTRTVDIPSQIESELIDYRCLSTTEKRIFMGDLLALKQPEQAQEVLAQALEANDANVEVLVALSRAHLNDYESSYKYAYDAIQADGNHIEANIRMGDLLAWPCLLEDLADCPTFFRQAANSYRNALRIDPLRVDAAFGLGVVYLNSGRAGDALNYLRVAYQRAPWSPRTNFYLGESYRRIGDNRRAQEYLTKAFVWESQKEWQTRAALALQKTLE